MKKMSKKAKVILIFVTLFVVSIVLNTIYISKYVDKKKELQCTLFEYEQLLFKEHEHNLYTFIGEYNFLKNEKVPSNDTTVYKFIKETGCWYPEIIMAQYVIESNHGKSGLSQEYNNCFGMKYVGKNGRWSTQVVDVKGYGDYGTYVNWQLSVIDRQLWDFAIFKGAKPTKDYYLNILGKLYAEDPNYLDKIDKESKKWNF